MELPPVPHSWSVGRKEAVAIQRELALRVRTEPPPGFRPRFVAGVDAAFPAGGAECLAAAVVWDTGNQCIVEERTAYRPLLMPYLPGLLSFREAPAVLAALAGIEIRVDAMICDGQGLAHPRHFGLACHLGVLTGIPTAGCAKGVLVGTHPDPGPARGDRAPLVHGGMRIGTVLRTRARTRPVVVSVGHRLDLVTAEELVLGCGRGFRMPEPTRQADALVSRVRREHRSRMLAVPAHDPDPPPSRADRARVACEVRGRSAAGIGVRSPGGG